MEKQQIINQIIALLDGVTDTAQLKQILTLVQTLVGTTGASNGSPSPNGQHEAMNTDTMSREEFFKKLRGY